MQPNQANYVALSPVSFLRRAAQVYPKRPAVIYGQRCYSYRQLAERSGQLANALRAVGVASGDRVAIMAPNIPELLEAHYGVPGAGAVLTPINTRLDGDAVGFILRHSRARVLLVDAEYAALAERAITDMPTPPLLVIIVDQQAATPVVAGDIELDYEAFLQRGGEGAGLCLPEDEWQALSLNYTSGTTGNPKGVLLHHRGAYLNACANALAFQLGPQSVYLWTLPMFHCNGWTYTWAVTMVGGTHVCLRAVVAADVYAAIETQGVSHMCAAPVVLNMLIHAPAEQQRRFTQSVSLATGGAAPPTPVIAAMEQRGFRITHLYGMTESYGPATICLWQPEVDGMDLEQRSRFMARQGVAHPLLEEVAVLDADTLQPVPADGETLGELVLRGNTVMQGYLDNPQATAEVFAGGWLHTGDLAVMHADGYVEIRDRSKDVIISGGENISSLEVEEVLYQHPDVMEAAVVARPDEHWGETPHAFVTLRPGASEAIDAEELVSWCRQHLARFKVPRYVSFCDLPKTSTGKIQKFVLRDWVRVAPELRKQNRD